VDEAEQFCILSATEPKMCFQVDLIYSRYDFVPLQIWVSFIGFLGKLGSCNLILAMEKIWLSPSLDLKRCAYFALFFLMKLRRLQSSKT